jgi:DnaJ-class molecular chaperone
MPLSELYDEPPCPDCGNYGTIVEGKCFRCHPEQESEN